MNFNFNVPNKNGKRNLSESSNEDRDVREKLDPFISLPKKESPVKAQQIKLNQSCHIHGKEMATDYSSAMSEMMEDDTTNESFENDSFGEIVSSVGSHSGTKRFSIATEFVTLSELETNGAADISGDSTCSSDSDLETVNYEYCLKCKERNNDNTLRYCESCYQIKKQTLPSKHKKRKRSISRDVNALSASSSAASSQDSGILVEDLIPESSFSQNNLHNKLCNFCHIKVKDSGFVHENTTHIGTCYSCAAKWERNSNICPFCNSKFSKILKIYE